MRNLFLRRGFTLMELMVVIAIIAVLASVAIVDYSHVKGKSRDGRRAVELKELDAAAQKYFQDNYKYPSTLADLTSYFDPGNFPKDPLTGFPYDYETNGSDYCLGAHMEEISNSVTCGALLNGSGDNYKISSQ